MSPPPPPRSSLCTATSTSSSGGFRRALALKLYTLYCMASAVVLRRDIYAILTLADEAIENALSLFVFLFSWFLVVPVASLFCF